MATTTTTTTTTTSEPRDYSGLPSTSSLLLLPTTLAITRSTASFTSRSRSSTTLPPLDIPSFAAANYNNNIYIKQESSEIYIKQESPDVYIEEESPDVYIKQESPDIKLEDIPESGVSTIDFRHSSFYSSSPNPPSRHPSLPVPLSPSQLTHRARRARDLLRRRGLRLRARAEKVPHVHYVSQVSNARQTASEQPPQLPPRGKNHHDVELQKKRVPRVRFYRKMYLAGPPMKTGPEDRRVFYRRVYLPEGVKEEAEDEEDRMVEDQ